MWSDAESVDFSIELSKEKSTSAQLNIIAVTRFASRITYFRVIALTFNISTYL